MVAFAFANPPRKPGDHDAAIILGPEVIATISRALEVLMPWLAESRFTVLENGNLRFDEPEPAEAVKMLRAATEKFLDEEVRETLGRRSGLGWNVFFGHVVTWWLPLRRQLGFLRALENRAALHQIHLHIAWNQGQVVPVTRETPGREALIWGGVGGMGAGFLAVKMWPGNPTLALLALGAGVVAGRVYQRVATVRRCGDPLCRTELGRKKTCPQCGAMAGNGAQVTVH